MLESHRNSIASKSDYIGFDGKKAIRFFSHDEKISKETDSISTSSSSSDSTIPPAPDGGWGWVIVFSSFMIHFIVDGIGFAFGVIYVSFLDYFQTSKSKTAFIVSLYYAMPLLAGPMASILVDNYGCRKMTMIGGFISFLGFFTSIFIHRIEALYVTMGIITGLGLSLVNVASIVIVAFYFDSKRAFATGISTSGSGVGATVIGACVELLLQRYGWRGTILLFSGLFLNIIALGALMRPVEWPESLATARRSRKYMEKLVNFQQLSSKHPGRKVALLTGDVINLDESRLNVDNKSLNLSYDGHNETSDSDTEKKAHSTLDIPTYLTKNPMLSTEAYEALHKDYNVDNLVQLLPLIQNGVLLNDMICNNYEFQTKATGFKDHPHFHDIWTEHVDKMRKAERYRFLRLNRSNITSKGCMLNTPKYAIKASSCPDVYTSTLQRDEDAYTFNELMKELWDTIKSMCDFDLLKDITYLLFFLSNFMLCLCDDIPHLYVVDLAINTGIDPVKAGFLLSIMGFLSTIGQIIFGYLADRPNMNTIYLYTIATAGCGLSCFGFTFIQSYIGLMFLCATYGLLISANYSLTSIILVDLMGLEEFTSSYGLILTAQGVGSLAGPAIGGFLGDLTHSYNYTFYFAGVLILTSGLIMLIEPLVKRWRKQRKRHPIFTKLTISDNIPKTNLPML